MSLYVQSTSFGRGYAWIAEAWPYFARNPLGWIGAMVVFFILSMVVGIIPLGGIVLNIFYPVVVGGFMLGCIAHKEGGSFEFQHMFAGFKEPYFKRLAMLGLFYTLLTFAAIILLGVLAFVMLGGFEFFQEIEQAQIEDVSAYATDIMLLTLIGATLFTPCIMAIWFAPTIIISSEEMALSAMLLSFNACLKKYFTVCLVRYNCFYLGNYSFYSTHARLFGVASSS